MFDLAQEQAARERQLEGVRYVAEYPYEYEEDGEKKPWIFVATDSESQAVSKRFDDLVQSFRKGKHKFGPNKPMGRKEKLSALNLLRLRQQAFIERGFTSSEFGFKTGEEVQVFKADQRHPEELHKAKAALVELLWSTRLEMVSDLVSDVADHVRDAGGEDVHREKD